MVEPAMQRAMLLIEQSNFQRAESELKVALSQEPNNEEALVLLALCKYNVGEYLLAQETVERAISINPANDFAIHLLARIYFALRKSILAMAKIDEAILLNPYNADYFGVKAQLHLNSKDFKDALSMANEGLSVDPENLNCLNIRSAALGKLGDKEAAYETINTALETDPNNAFTHANFGFTLLEKREYDKALVHFKEALKNDPNSEYAKAGLIEALKSKFFIYSLFLRYSFWIGNLKGKLQWAFIIGFYVLFRVLRSTAENNSSLQPVLIPIMVGMFIFAFSSWFLSPLHDLFLFLNPYGKYALSNREKRVARLVGALLFVAMISLLIYAFFSTDHWLGLAGFSLLMLIPIGSMYNGETKRSDQILVSYTVITAIIGLLALWLSLVNGILINFISFFFLIAIFVYQWVANFVISKANR